MEGVTSADCMVIGKVLQGNSHFTIVTHILGTFVSSPKNEIQLRLCKQNLKIINPLKENKGILKEHN